MRTIYNIGMPLREIDTRSVNALCRRNGGKGPPIQY
jgi:hypothetical protein